MLSSCVQNSPGRQDDLNSLSLSVSVSFPPPPACVCYILLSAYTHSTFIFEAVLLSEFAAHWFA